MSLETQYLERRVRRTYRDGWSYLDPHEDVGTAIILQRSGYHVYDDDGYEGAHSSVVLMVTSASNASPAKVKEAIQDTFGGSNCQHEYDCCGCWSSYAHNIHHVEDNIWSFDISASRNY